VLDEIDALIDQIPDPRACMPKPAPDRCRPWPVAQPPRRGDHRTGRDADEHADSRVLGAGTTGMLVAVATGANPAAGSATVSRGNALQHLPQVAASFRAGRVSTAHVAVITAEAPKITRFASSNPRW
jgi:hypothetical protein